eukprot:TRINITY_DN23271_c0_g2_i1.p2 TRINITY_DN23271_c0_g2~~TRINITY_DN23271_c0_g2_i1.p2  ORF type:complete len:213 (-),score=68.39 TRINITY_DN23271_c0_g2_i1:164-802(-)
MEAVGAQVLQQIAQGDFATLVEKCEELELLMQESMSDDANVTAEEAERVGKFYAAHLLAYFLDAQLSAARFLWMRTPAAVQALPEPAAAHSALQAWWFKKHAEVDATLSAGAWDEALRPLVAEVVTRQRERLLDRIGNAYKVLALSRISAITGMSEAEVVAACGSREWAIDAASNVTPEPVKVGQDLLQAGDTQLQKLAEYVAYLEQPQTCS